MAEDTATAIDSWKHNLELAMDKHHRELKRWILLCFLGQTLLFLGAGYLFLSYVTS